MNLQIVYQDDWLVAVDKPAGHLVHPAELPQEGDLVTMKILRDQIGQRVYNVHRLDRPTTGVLLFALDREVGKSLHRAFENHAIKKNYLAAVCGKPPMESWRCSLPLSKDEGDPKKEAVTDFRVLIHEPHTEIDEGLSLIEARPLTGRFHQIRRHLLSAGFPIVGDYRYAGVEQSDRLGELLGTGTRMLLQARKLEFMHPVSEENITIRAPLVEELARCFSSELQSDLL